MSEHVKFVRIRGRVVPIGRKKKHKKADKMDILKGASIGIAGVSLSLFGAHRASNFAKKFSKKLSIPALLGTIFVGEAVAAEGLDKATESLHLSARSEQNVKNITAGTLGVMAAASALGGSKMKKIKKITKLMR